jgi:hypothetical protein
MISGFLQRRNELQRKVLFAPRGPRKREALKELRELVRQELVAEQAQRVAAPAPTPLPEPPPDLFDPASGPPPRHDPYGGREPWWLDQ